MKDLYGTLGVKNDADASEIKKAYKKLASKYHPDKNPDDPKAKTMFQAIQEAYEILSDPEKRKRYDETGEMDDSGPTKTDMAAKMIFDLFIHHAEIKGYQRMNYFKIVKKDIKTARGRCENDIKDTNKTIERFKYLMENSKSNGLLDKAFEMKLLSLRQFLLFCENGKDVLNEALDILDGKCQYDGEDEEVSASLEDMFKRNDFKMNLAP